MSKKSSKRRLNPTPRKKPHQFTLPGGSTMTFRTREEMLRVKSLYEIFQLPGKDNKPQKTNMDVAVRMTSDNPLLKPKLTKAQQPIIDLKVIPTEEFEKKYKRTAAGDMKKVSSVNPYGKIKATPKKKEEKKETPPKDWVGPPYTEEELLPQNIRYTKALNNIQSTTCTSCTGTDGKYVAVNDCDGNGPYFFPCAIFEDTTPTNAILGIPVSCAGPGNPYYYACQNPCWGSQWVPILIDDCLQGWNECASLKQDPVCITTAPTCATPGIAQSVSPSSSALDPCACVVGYVTNGSFASGWDPNRGFWVMPSTLTNPGVGSQLMGEQDAFNLIVNATSGAPYNLTAPVSSSGSIAKFGTKIYTSFVYYGTQGNPNIHRMAEVEIDPGGTTIVFSNMYTETPTASAFSPGAALCAKNATTLFNVVGTNVEQLTLDPATNSFTRTVLFNTVAQTAGDIVYDPFTNTVWIAQIDSTITHYNMSGTVLGVVALPPSSTVISMWCEAGEVLFYVPAGAPAGGFKKIDKTNYTLIPLGSSTPLIGVGGDAASDPNCCGQAVQPTICATPGQI